MPGTSRFFLGTEPFNLHTPNCGQGWPEEVARRTAGLVLPIMSKQSKFCCVEQGEAATHVGLLYGGFLKSEEIFLHQRKLGTNPKTAGTGWSDLAGHGDPDIFQPTGGWRCAQPGGRHPAVIPVAIMLLV